MAQFLSNRRGENKLLRISKLKIAAIFQKRICGFCTGAKFNRLLETLRGNAVRKNAPLGGFFLTPLTFKFEYNYTSWDPVYFTQFMLVSSQTLYELDLFPYT